MYAANLAPVLLNFFILMALRTLNCVLYTPSIKEFVDMYPEREFA